MNLPLKSYQSRVLDSVGENLRDVARTGDPANPFQRITAGLGHPAPYVSASNLGLPHGLPYVCLRVPTGGGKTLLGAHTVGIVQRDYLQADRCLVLWLVPSNLRRSMSIRSMISIPSNSPKTRRPCLAKYPPMCWLAGSPFSSRSMNRTRHLSSAA